MHIHNPEICDGRWRRGPIVRQKQRPCSGYYGEVGAAGLRPRVRVTMGEVQGKPTATPVFDLFIDDNYEV